MFAGSEATACQSVQARWYSCRSCTSPESINQSVSPFHPVKGSLVLTCCPTCEDINGNTDPRDFCSGFLVLLTFATWSILNHRTCLLVVSLALRANLSCCEKKPKSLKTGWNLRLLSCLVVLVTVVETARQIPTQSVLLFTGSWLIFRVLHVPGGNKSSYIQLAGGCPQVLHTVLWFCQA